MPVAACSMPAQSLAVQIFSSWFCPYAQRVWIALEELAVPYEWSEVQPYLCDGDGNPTKNPKSLHQKALEHPGFIEASPKGLVPAIVVRDTATGSVCKRRHESLVCVEYIDSEWGGGRLQSRDAAVQRGITVVEDEIIPHFYRLLMANEPAAREVASFAIRRGLLKWGAVRPADAAAQGPFFLGKLFSAADLALAPWWPQRCEWIAGTYRGFRLPSTPEYTMLYCFAQAVTARPSVASTLVDRERLVR
jgi:glutathione S-transferase